MQIPVRDRVSKNSVKDQNRIAGVFQCILCKEVVIR